MTVAHVDLVEGRELGGGVLRFLQAQRDGLAQPASSPRVPRAPRWGAGRPATGAGAARRVARRGLRARPACRPWCTRPSLPVPATRRRRRCRFLRRCARPTAWPVRRLSARRRFGAAGAARLRRWRGLGASALGAAAGLAARAGLAFGDGAEQRADLHGVAGLRREMDSMRAVGGRGHFHRHLVGLEFQQRLVARDRVAFLLEPARDGGFGDGFAHRGHFDFDGHDRSLRRSRRRLESQRVVEERVQFGSVLVHQAGRGRGIFRPPDIARARVAAQLGNRRPRCAARRSVQAPWFFGSSWHQTISALGKRFSSCASTFSGKG